MEPTGTPATLTLLPRDQLGGVLELGGDGVGGAAAEDEQQDDDDRADQRENRRDPADRT